MAFLRLAEEANRNAQRVLPLGPNDFDFLLPVIKGSSSQAQAAATDSGTKPIGP
jgi:hypothetical protein